MNLEWMKLQDSVTIHPADGLISLRGNRLLLFHADALSQLKDELIKSLGYDLARGILARFGYRCGFNDSQSFKHLFDFKSDAEWMLFGPKIHTLEGMVRATNEVLDYDRSIGHFYMRGKWELSYEAEEYLKMYGSTSESVCWTLVGYASGYCSGFFGQEAVCVETKCVAKGDPYCEYEVRAKDEWGGLADRNWFDLQPNTAVKSLQHMLKEERERINQWKFLNELTLHLSNGLNFNESEKEFYHQVCQLVACENAFLVLRQNDSNVARIFRYNLGSDRVSEYQGLIEGALGNFMAGGVNIRLHGSKLPTKSAFFGINNELLGVPLILKNRQLGYLFVANKLSGEGFTEYDENLLSMLAVQVAMVMENTRLYRLTDRQLQEKNNELKKVNEHLVKQQKSLQKSIDLHDKLTGIVLENSGLKRIAEAISQTIGLPVLIEDTDFKTLASAKITEKMSTSELLAMFPAESHELFYKNQTIVIQTVDPLGKQVRCCLTPVMGGKEILGFLTVELGNTQLTEENRIILRDASIVIALEILKMKVLIENKRSLVKNLLDEWLFSELFSEERVLDLTVKLGLKLEYPLSQLVLDFEGDRTGQMSKWIKEAVDIIPANGVMSFEENRIIVMVCQDKGNKMIESIMQEFIKGLESIPYLDWWITIGASSLSISEARENYKNASAANKIMKNLKKNHTCFRYEKLGIYGMLGIHPERFVWFAKKLLGEVIEYDEKHKTELVQTLKLYYQNNQNIQAAARRSFINDGTLKYRLKRIQEISKLDLADPEISLQVQMALKFL